MWAICWERTQTYYADAAEDKIPLGKSEKIIINEDDLDLKEGEELFHMGQIMAENELNDSKDKKFALDLYRVAAESGHPLAEEKYLKLFETRSIDLVFECENVADYEWKLSLWFLWIN